MADVLTPDPSAPAAASRPAARPPVDPRVRRARRRTTRTAWLLRLVAVGYVLALVALPVASVVQHTFADGVAPVLDVLTSEDFLAALRLTAVVAGVAVALNTVFGVGMGYLLVRYRFWGRRFLSAVIDLPVSISPIVVGVALILVYGTYGWFGGALEDAGIRVIFSVPGMVLATVLVSLPLVLREVVPTLEEAGIEQEQAAQSLGANAWQRFWRITLPTIRWALAYGVALSLARSLGEFGAVRVVSGSVAGESQTLTLYVNDSYQEFGADAQRQAFAAAFVLMTVAVVLIVVIAALRPEEDKA
ncbi:sulfate ABC transporter permease [Cellulomonas uda]|uniref:Sulfate ABC transporter permease subunit CysW n=1 Tax=Cellulomonas uda TaxID=1714 RepID=A0A4Y3KBS9_CELUD|nr:sulfate ABC transporter permease subunit [Cellulomonas uda]NII66434.1 sulfate transport system permease protein [Cellulomonas uda]GEA80300.1 sulfate ABC transporter permease subunit CysW [Cellulomonas uda]